MLRRGPTVVAYEGSYSRFVELRAERRLAAQRAFDSSLRRSRRRRSTSATKLAAVTRRRRWAPQAIEPVASAGTAAGAEGAMAVRFEAGERRQPE